MRIIILDGQTLNPGDNPWDPLIELCEPGNVVVHDRTAPEDVVTRSAGAQIVITNKVPLTRATLEALPDLRFIAVTATGHNVVDSKAARERGIPVSNVPTYGTDTVAQHTFALLLELCHRVGLHAASVSAGEWQACPDFCYWKSPLIELKGRQLGIVGRGRIGQRVASLAAAFGMHVRFASTSQPDGSGDMPSIGELFAESDMVSLHCALTPANERFVNAPLLARMKPSAFLINTSRGQLIDEEALAAALEAGVIAGAATDVLSKEPPVEGHPLMGRADCIVTPHMAWTGLQARSALMTTTIENVKAFLRGEPVNVVNA